MNNNESVSVFFELTYKPLKLRTRSIRTIKLYETSIRHFDKYLGRRAVLSDFNDDTVGRLLAWHRLDRRLSPFSVNKERDNLLAMWRFACRKGLVDEWPDVEPEIEPEEVPTAWTESDLVKLFAYLGTIPGMVGAVKSCDFWRALVLVIWNTGERISAVMDVRWQDVDLDGKWITFRAGTRKGRRRGLRLAISDETVAALRAVKVRGQDAVFHWPLTRSYLWGRYGAILKRGGFPHDNKSKFHRIRKSTASHFEAAGGDSCELLGHSSKRITRAYLDPRIIQKPQAAGMLFRLGG